MDSPTEPPLPTFLIIGAQKSATRWLRSNLGKHPDIFAAPIELSFFNQKYRRGLDFYRSQFEGWEGEPIVGEATPGYMMARHRPPRVAKRIYETVPDVRLIVLLRDPIDRANSALLHHVKRGRLKKRSKLVDVITTRDPLEDRLCLVSGGWYSESLEPYIKLFGDQLLVVLYDDIADDPKWVYQSVLEHVGASPDFVPPDLDEIVFSNQGNRRSGVSRDDRQKLWPFFEEDIGKLEPLIARDLSGWDPTPDRVRWPEPSGDLVEDHREGMGWVDQLVANVTPDQLDEPTPCPDWTVGKLLAHMTQLALLNAGPLQIGPSESPDAIVDLLESDPVTAFQLASARLSRAVDETSDSRAALVSPGMTVPKPVYIFANLVNQVGHGWDLANATGQDPSIPPDLASRLEVFARDLYAGWPVLRGGLADEVTTRDDASPTDRFLALLGRDPSVTSPVRPS